MTKITIIILSILCLFSPTANAGIINILDRAINTKDKPSYSEYELLDINDYLDDVTETAAAITDIDIAITDEVDDVTGFSNCAHDIKEIYAKTTPGYLILKAVTSTNILKCLEASNTAGPIMEVYIDSDNDTSTGQKTLRAQKPGFEFYVKLLAGIDYGNHGSILEGRIRRSEAIDHFASHYVGNCQENPLCSSTVINSFDDTTIKNSKLGENFIAVRIPIDKLQLGPGQKIRLIFRESCSDDINDGSFSDEKSLILK